MDQADFDLVLTLSPREFDVFLELGKGEKLVDIAKTQMVSIKTVETQVAACKTKLEQPNTFKMRAFATRYLIWEESNGVKRVERHPKALANFKFEKAA